MAKPMNTTFPVSTDGLKALIKELKRIDAEYVKELKTIHKDLAIQATEWSRTEANRLGGVHRHFSNKIKPGSANMQGARISVDGVARVAIFGALRRTGWNAKAPKSRPQHPPWVGANWEFGVAGEGPYAINKAVADHTDEIVESYMDAIDDLVRRAFSRSGAATVRTA